MNSKSVMLSNWLNSIDKVEILNLFRIPLSHIKFKQYFILKKIVSKRPSPQQGIYKIFKKIL